MPTATHRKPRLPDHLRAVDLMDSRTCFDALLARRHSCRSFTLAAAVVHGDVRVLQFTEEGLSDAAVLAAAQKAIPVDDSTRDWKGVMPTARVDISMQDGRIFTGIGDGAPGSQDSPMGWDALSCKFAECASLAANRPSDRLISEALGMAKSLEELPDANVIMRALC